mgnify:CR=1 FL=1
MLAVAENQPIRLMDHRSLTNTVKAAEICGVTRLTIYQWVRYNRVEWVRTPTGQLRIFVDSLFRR